MTPHAWAIAELSSETTDSERKALPRGLRDLPESELLRRVSRALDRLAPSVRRIFSSAVARLGGSVDRTRLLAAIEVGDGRLGADAYAWEAFRSELQQIEQPKLQAYTLGSAAADRLVSIATREQQLAEIRGAEELAREWARRNAAKLVTVIEEETRRGIADLVRNAAPNRPPMLLKRGILGVLRTSDYAGLAGLDRPRARSLALFADKLAQQEIPPEKARALVLREKNRLLGERAKVIARTELAATANAGKRDTWRQRIGTYLDEGEHEQEWVALLRTAPPVTCERCEAFDGARAPLVGGQFRSKRGEVSEGPILHPACYCTSRIVRREAVARRAA